MENIIETKKLTKRYGDAQVVDGINISIRRGEIFGFLGPNGAGKTTTISMLSTLLEPTSGSAVVSGFDVVGQPGEVKKRIGLVPQDLALYPTLNALDNLLYFGRIYGLRGKSLHQRVDEVLRMVSLEEFAKAAVKTYSGGMKRRLDIAAGLLHDPEMLFLDEPTVGVDPQSRNAIFEHVKALREGGMTILYTTHYMEEAQQLCDRVAIIDQGRIIALDSPAKLIADLGGGLIRLGVADEKMNGKLVDRLQTLEEVKTVVRLNGKVRLEVLHTQNALVQILDLFQQTDTQINSLQVLEPNLETVFLQLTGKKLRE
jgi:ABC-2 type transport system ATP-binding protein